jgi:hypothetical protein
LNPEAEPFAPKFRFKLQGPRRRALNRNRVECTGSASNPLGTMSPNRVELLPQSRVWVGRSLRWMKRSCFPRTAKRRPGGRIQGGKREILP